MWAGCPQIPGRRPQVSTALSTGPELDATDELVDLVEDRLALGHLLLDLVDGVHDGRVVAAPELLGDPGIAVVGQLTEDVHPDLAGGDERPAAALAAEVFDGPAEHQRGLVEDQLGCDDPGLAGREEIGE